jgi:hypothetical protein
MTLPRILRVVHGAQGLAASSAVLFAASSNGSAPRRLAAARFAACTLRLAAPNRGRLRAFPPPLRNTMFPS